MNKRVAVICKSFEQFTNWCKDNEIESFTKSMVYRNGILYDCIIKEHDLYFKTFDDYIELHYNHDIKENIKYRLKER